MRTTAERSSEQDATIHPIFCQHLAVYEYAQQFVSGKNVLDVGCGEGYGSSLLAERASRVLGMDYSQEAIERARQNHASANNEFICSDIADFYAKEMRFDVVCAFQFIEHLKNPKPFLAKVESLLGKGGALLLSTPNRRASIVQHPYHFREYTREELEEELSQYFAKTDIYGLQFSQKVYQFRQKRKGSSERLLRLDPLGLHRLLPRSVRQKVFDCIAAVLSRKIYKQDQGLLDEITSKDYWVSEKEINAAIDLVAVCRK